MSSILDEYVNLKSSQEYTPETWEYLAKTGLRQDAIKDSLEQETKEKFQKLAVMITQRQESELFEFIIKFANAKNCIEVGVFTGSSALSIARGLGDDGKLIALDISEEFTNVAKKYWEEAGVSNKIDLIIGPASENLNRLIEEGKEGFFDFAYVDADKSGYLGYFEYLVRLIRKGGIIAFDNVIRANGISDPSRNDEDVLALRELNSRLLNDTRIKNFILPVADGLNFVQIL